MPELAYLNGDIIDLNRAYVPIEDRGYQFGDAVYEVISGYNGALFSLNLHMQRLANSMDGLAFPEMDLNALEKDILDFYKASKLCDCILYLQVSRGTEPRNHAPGRDLVPQVVMTVKSNNGATEALRENGIGAITVADMRWGRCDLKTVQLVANCLAKKQALDQGQYDAIFVDKRRIVKEGTSSNVFVAKDGVLFTHPLDRTILPGITRIYVLEICGQNDIEVRQQAFDTEFLYGADEVMLTGTITEIMPVINVDGRSITNGAPGPLQKMLQAKLKAAM